MEGGEGRTRGRLKGGEGEMGEKGEFGGIAPCLFGG